jgi:SAM-dependent methyltransferase
MYPDIVDLRQFYETPLGRTVRRTLRRKLREFWPEPAGYTTLGFGYAAPYLRLDDTFSICVMPPAQGVTYWPAEGPGRVVLATETELPFADCSFDRILVMHGLEALELRRPLMRELWRILKGQGRLLVVAPNRRGIWARTERTPFGHGSPYSISQLSQTMRENMFVPERTARCLYFPPLEWSWFLAAAPAWEKVGQRWFSTFGGITLVEASKQLYALSTDNGALAKRRGMRIPVLASPQISQQSGNL